MINEDWSTESPGNTPDYSFLPEGLRDFAVPNPFASRPAQGTGLTVENRKELAHVMAHQKGLSQEDIRFIKSVASSPIDEFYRYLVIRGIKPKRSDISDIWFSEYYNKIINDMKDSAKRARPYWISNDISPIDGTEVSSYSYPSGHAILSWVIARKLTEKYPHLRDGLENLARRISVSRVQAGVHFPSDIEPAEKISNILIDLKNR